MISTNGWNKFCIWEHSATVKDLYARRCRLEAEEMTCAAQAAELLQPRVDPGDSLLDAGCGSGYFYHSLRSRSIPAEYWGLDAAESLVAIGREILPGYGLPADRLISGRIEDLDAKVDHVLCMNVLSNIDNFHRPLERLLLAAGKSLVLRESVGVEARYSYVKDKYLDGDVDLKVHVNTYAEQDVVAFMESYGFEVQTFIDRRTDGEAEMIIDYPHHWKFLLATRLTR